LSAFSQEQLKEFWSDTPTVAKLIVELQFLYARVSFLCVKKYEATRHLQSETFPFA